ncbi:glycosyltransferase family 2 protein [Parahaliea maris]|uniref:Glycosyltransferase family 2 protein n=1 Tax=Parahaliea maris TaxID=2716870 RepID=A0A5C9A1Z2_9GAMM|nr:glycosyltransferase [Parahaliea maris]TXS93962.1 glycosyltransferase family 2 protein [Parahaliea maris]
MIAPLRRALERRRLRSRRRQASEQRHADLHRLALSDRSIGIGNTEPQEIVVSLTSYDRRIPFTYLCVESLLRQSLKPDRLVLWLSRKDFPDEKLPDPLLNQVERGLEIIFHDEDLGPYKKVIYALEQCPDSLLITVDDDTLYPPDLVESLYRAYLARPDTIHCHRGHRLRTDSTGRPLSYAEWGLGQGGHSPSPLVFPTGVGGVLYFPGALHPEVLNREQFMRLCPRADDIWLKAMSLMQGVPCAVVPDETHWKDRFLTIPGSQGESLKRENWDRRLGNDSKIAAVFEAYDLFHCVNGKS